MAILKHPHASHHQHAHTSHASHASHAPKKLRSPHQTTRRTKKAAAAAKQHAINIPVTGGGSTSSSSAPASPMQTPTPTPMEVQITPVEEKKSAKSSAPASPVVTMSDSASATPSQASSPAVTPAEQKMIDTIQSVSQRIDQLASQLPTLAGQITNHLTRLCLFKWHPKSKSWSFDAEKLIRAHKQLHYAAGMVGENVLQQVFRLDSIQTENPDIRKLRKATVGKANEIIKASMRLRERLEKWKRFLPTWTPPPTEEKPVPMEVEAPATKTSKEEEKEEEKAMQDDEQRVEEPVPAPKQAQIPPKAQSPPTPTRAAAPAPTVPASTPATSAAPAPAPAPAAASLTPLQKKYAHLRLPTYAGPSFHARVHPYSGSLVIEADLDGISSEDLTVIPDAKNRTITIQGVRLPERRRSVPHPYGGFYGAPVRPPQPFGFFTKVIDLDEVDPHRVLDLSGLKATVDARHHLQIILPRAKPVQTARPLQQKRSAPSQPHPYRRAPVQHSTGVSYSSEEEDEPDMYSHPFTSPYYRQPPQPTYRRAAPPAQPFFSGFW
jgi:hypothetical protein